jgi:flagellar biosynthesis component FlhA
LGGSVGVGLAALAATYAARFASAQFPHHERLAQAVGRHAVERASIDRLLAAGRVTPSTAKRRQRALSEEIETLGDGRQIYRLMRSDAAIGLALAACLLVAGLISGQVFKGWPWSLTLTQLTLYGLGEAILTAIPGLVFGVTLGQWLGAALEEVTDLVRDPEEAPERTASPLMVLEVGRELAPSVRRAFPEAIALIRTRLARDLGLQLPRVDVVCLSGIPPRGWRVVVRGTAWVRGELRPNEGMDGLAEALTDAARANAAQLLTLDATQTMLDDRAEDHPVAVSQALERHGVATVHGVLQSLLAERVPVHDVVGILEGLAAAGEAGDPAASLAERLRKRLALPLMQSLADERGVVRALELAPEWEPALAESGRDERDLARALAEGIQEVMVRQPLRSGRLVLIAPASHRARLAALLTPLVPGVAVIAPDELSPRCELRPVGVVERRTEIPWKAPLSLLKVAGS